jgi:hypothetical protein
MGSTPFGNNGSLYLWEVHSLVIMAVCIYGGTPFGNNGRLYLWEVHRLVIMAVCIYGKYTGW